MELTFMSKYNSEFSDTYNLMSHIKKDNKEPKEGLLDSYLPFDQHQFDMILIFSLDGTIISDNKQSLNAYLGYTSGEKSAFKEILSKDDYARLQSAFQQARSGTITK